MFLALQNMCSTSRLYLNHDFLKGNGYAETVCHHLGRTTDFSDVKLPPQDLKL